ncbi:MAG: ABC transporter substrate-binding protein [Brevinematales bacterium]|nr:ABC transporter substrate-binding protein [Brevinematales bacterium]
MRVPVSVVLLILLFSCGKPDQKNIPITPPERVVSLAPSLTEMMFAIGEGSRLAGVTAYCDYPPAVTNLPKVGGLSDFDIEKVAALKPGLVLASWSGNPKDKVERLESLGIHVLILKENTVADILTNLAMLAGVFGKNPADILAPMIGTLSALPASDKSPSALVVISMKPVFSASTQSFIGDVLRIAGYSNTVQSSAAYPMLSEEMIAGMDPDYLFIADDFAKEKDYFDSLVKIFHLHAKIYFIDTDTLSRPGPRIADFIAGLAALKDNQKGDE